METTTKIKRSNETKEGETFKRSLKGNQS